MKSPNYIEHKGVIKEVNNRVLKVSIERTSACDNCHVKGFCNIVETKSQIIEITNPGGDLSVGDSVDVIFEQSVGFKALLLGYLLPFIILIVTLIVAYNVSGKELIAGLISISALVPYYIVLYFLRDRIKKEFIFRIKK